jgi:hypothetical protein
MRTRIAFHSFTRFALSAARSRASPPFPPRHRRIFHDAVLDELLQERVGSSRNRRNPRGVKRKMSNFPLRRRTHNSLPPINIEKAIKVLK